MGTRSLTKVYDRDGHVLVCMYRQFDGYPAGHGEELAAFLSPRTVINGFSAQSGATHANGMDCLAAQIVWWFKGQRSGSKAGRFQTWRDEAPQIGHIYLMPPDTTMDKCGGEYEYRVRPAGEMGKLRLEVLTMHYDKIGESEWKGSERVLFSGPLSDFGPWCERQVG